MSGEEVHSTISDTGGVGDKPQVLNPINIPNIQPGALMTEVPTHLHTLTPLWARNVAPVWAQMGLAVPGCGGRLRTANPAIHLLFEKVGIHAQSVAFDPCARLSRWPEMDVLKTMHKCYINARDYLNSSLVPDAQERPRATVAGSQSLAFSCYFMPFFGTYMRNGEIKYWLTRIMELMSLLMVSGENSFTYGLSQTFVNQCAVPLRDAYKFMLANLLKVDPAKITDDYIATDADFAAYAAAQLSADNNLANAQGSIDPIWSPSAADRQWCAGAYSYLEAAPLLALWPEGSIPAIPTDVTGQQGTTGSKVTSGGIATT